jgi:16S rRNA (uracil1498-N3)-methyltransferase
MPSKIRLYFSKELKSNLLSNLSNEQSHYIKNVMRLKPGDTISLFNSTNGEWRAKIVNHSKENTEFKVEKLIENKKLENDLWLAFSPIKKNYLDMMIQKTTELGIQKFIPILSERTIVKDINTERLKKIIIEASEQSNRISVPEIKNLEPLKDFLKKFPNNGCLIFCDINCEKSDLKNILSKKKQGPVCILIGPEGDFSEKERQLIIEKKEIFSLSLAQNLLRAETAAIAAVTIVNYHLNFN